MVSRQPYGVRCPVGGGGVSLPRLVPGDSIYINCDSSCVHPFLLHTPHSHVTDHSKDLLPPSLQRPPPKRTTHTHTRTHKQNALPISISIHGVQAPQRHLLLPQSRSKSHDFRLRQLPVHPASVAAANRYPVAPTALLRESGETVLLPVKRGVTMHEIERVLGLGCLDWRLLGFGVGYRWEAFCCCVGFFFV